MTTYIVKGQNELHLYQIRDDQKESFLVNHSSAILTEAETIREALAKLNELPLIFVSPD
jgi:hypothetical protein